MSSTPYYHTTVRFLELKETVSLKPQSEQPTPLLLPLLSSIKKTAKESGYSTGNKIYAHFRFEELLEVGCTVDSPATTTLSSNNNKNGRLIYSNRAPNSIRCGHQHRSLNNFTQQGDDAHSFQTEFNNTLKDFVGRFVNNFDDEKKELVPDGSFYVIFSCPDKNDDDFLINAADAEFYCVLASEPPPVPVILDHDGGVDDLVALLVLASASVKPLAGMARRFDLLGTTIVDADCFAKPTGELCRRLFCMFGAVSDNIPKLPVGVSPLEGTAFPFPNEWRKDCLAMLDFPCLHTDAVNEAMEKRPVEIDGNGHELLAKLVMESPRPVTIVVTGPLTNVAFCINKYGENFTKNVRELSIMGGAVHVPGNVINADLPKTAHDVDKSAEWNIYWDAPAAKTVLESPLIRHKLLYSLDATNHVPVTPAFVRRFGKVTTAVKTPACVSPVQVPTQLSVFCGNSWAMTTFLSFMFGEDRGYFAWDVLCAMGVLVPTISKYEEVKLVVDADSKSPSEGRTKPDEENGKVAHVALKINAEAFYELVLESAALF